MSKKIKKPKFIEEFQKFAFKGNVVDMAVGVIIGGAFGKIVTSLVNDVVMPIFGWLGAGMDFKSLKFILSAAVMEGDVVVKPEAAILYGNFIQNIVDFLLIAISIFVALKIIFAKKNREEAAAAAKAAAEAEAAAKAAAEAPVPPTELELLAEIRDLLKENQK